MVIKILGVIGVFLLGCTVWLLRTEIKFYKEDLSMARRYAETLFKENRKLNEKLNDLQQERGKSESRERN